jgi:hypothetical protein
MASMTTTLCETVRMPAKPKRPRDPNPKSDVTRRLDKLMAHMEELDEQALAARLAFGQALKEARDAGTTQDEIVRDLDTNRELLRRIQRRYEESAKG